MNNYFYEGDNSPIPSWVGEGWSVEDTYLYQDKYFIGANTKQNLHIVVGNNKFNPWNKKAAPI